MLKVGLVNVVVFSGIKVLNFLGLSIIFIIVLVLVCVVVLLNSGD